MTAAAIPPSRPEPKTELMTEVLMPTAGDAIAEALDRNFTSPNVTDANYGDANVVDAVASLAAAVRFAARHLGKEEASESMGAIELHAKAILDSGERIEAGLFAVSDAVERFTAAVERIAAGRALG